MGNSAPINAAPSGPKVFDESSMVLNEMFEAASACAMDVSPSTVRELDSRLIDDMISLLAIRSANDAAADPI